MPALGGVPSVNDISPFSMRRSWGGDHADALTVVIAEEQVAEKHVAVEALAFSPAEVDAISTRRLGAETEDGNPGASVHLDGVPPLGLLVRLLPVIDLAHRKARLAAVDRHILHVLEREERAVTIPEVALPRQDLHSLLQHARASCDFGSRAAW